MGNLSKTFKIIAGTVFLFAAMPGGFISIPYVGYTISAAHRPFGVILILAVFAIYSNAIMRRTPVYREISRD